MTSASASRPTPRSSTTRRSSSSASANVSIGISLDAPGRAIADRTRKDWSGQGVHGKVLEAMDRLRGYDAWSVICTMTRENARQLTGMVEFLHRREVPTCLMNIVRCTLPPSREVKPADGPAAKAFLAALERSYELYRETGRKLVVGNFANVLLAILAPTARRLMCDISPCGGGRCFFAVTPSGDMFPCSEFIGLEAFRGGNLFRDEVEQVLESGPFQLVTGRNVDRIDPCSRCAHPSLLRLALPGRGARDERGDGPDRRLLRVLRGADPATHSA